MCLAVALLAALAPACAPQRQAVDPTRGPARLDVIGEWRHIERSVEVAVGRAELALIGREISETQHRYELQSVRTEPGWLTVRPLVDPPFPDDMPIALRMETSIGFFGNPEAERSLLRAVAHRLRQLEGREWAPVRW